MFALSPQPTIRAARASENQTQSLFNIDLAFVEVIPIMSKFNDLKSLGEGKNS